MSCKESILRKLEALDRHEHPRMLAEGWTGDEEGRMIPPGWVRARSDVPTSPSSDREK